MTCRNGEAQTGLAQKSENIQTSHEKNYRASKWFSEVHLNKEFSLMSKGLGHVANGNSVIHVCPPFLIQARLRQCNRCFFIHSYLSCSNTVRLRSMAVVEYDDLNMSLRKISQFLMNYQCKLTYCLSDCSRIFFTPLSEKILFCTDKIESILWLNLEPLQSIDDCFEILPPHSKTL